MPVFEYKALDGKGKSVSGIMDAESGTAARQKLRNNMIFPISIKEISDTAVTSKTGFLSLRLSFRRIGQADISMMTRQLATLVGAGFPLVSALDALVRQIKSGPFKRIVAGIKDAVVEGNSLAGALSLYPSTFSSLYINMVQAGETSGTLEIVLERLADTMEKMIAQRNRIRSAMAYPILMTVLGAVVLFLLLTFIVPTITSIFEEMNQVLPVPTRILIAVSSLLRSYWPAVLILILGLVVLFRYLNHTSRGRYYFDKIKLMLPIAGPVINKTAVSRFARTLGSLLENGVSMLQALEIVKKIAGNSVIAEAIEESAKEVSRGKGLGDTPAINKMMPDLAVQMIQVGEQSGELEQMLTKLADVYENEVETTLMSLTSLLEPGMILIMAVIVCFIVFSILLPIFEMNQLIM